MTVSAMKKRRSFKRRLLLVLAALLALLLMLELRVKPAVASVAVIQGKRLCTEVINEAVSEAMEELELSYESLAEATRQQDGSVLEITTNTANVNKLKTEVSLRIVEKLDNIKNRRVDIPLGTLMGLDLLYLQGPSIPLNISMSGTAETDFASELESGGINQTVHRLSLIITADMTVLMPPAGVSTSVSTSVLIAETLIVGETPAYTLYGVGGSA